MKIGLVTPSWPGGRHANGITTTVVFLAQGLEALGHDVTIIPLADMAEEDPKCVPLPAQRPRTFQEKLFNKLGLRDPIHQIIAEQIAAATRIAIDTRGIDVLIMEETQGWAGIVQQLVDIPVIVTLHGPWYIQMALQSETPSKAAAQREQREAEAFRTCAGITAPSQHVLDQTIVQVPGMAGLQSVIHNPIQVKPPVQYDQLNEKQRKSILFVGRHDHRKGADILLQGFTDLVQNGGDVHLTFVGPDNGMLQPDGSVIMFPEVAAQLPDTVRERITHLGPQSKDQIDTLRQEHVLTVITSRYETFGYVVLEALAAGSATISTAAGGPTEIIRDGETGMLIPAGDADALTKAIQQLMDDPDLAKTLGQAGRQDVTDRFAPEKIAEQLAQFAQTVIDQHTSA